MPETFDDIVKRMRADALAIAQRVAAGSRGNARQAISQGGYPYTTNTGGYWDDDGQWQSYYRVGDPIGTKPLA